jgi:hypothetical protein
MERLEIVQGVRAFPLHNHHGAAGVLEEICAQ